MYLSHQTPKRQLSLERSADVKKLPALIFHAIPLIPFALQYQWLGVASLLMVGLAYIKVQKLRVIEAEELRKFGRRDEGVQKARKFWESLTFIPEK